MFTIGKFKMKYFLLLLGLSFNVFAFELPIVRIVDGDTISTKIFSMPRELQDYKIRVLGIDTPEKGHLAQCPKEAEMAIRASKFTREFIGQVRKMDVDKCSHDKYGGRIDCEVYINGKSLGDALIASGLARKYNGGKKSSWCE